MKSFFKSALALAVLFVLEGMMSIGVFAQWGNTIASRPSDGLAVFVQSTARWFLAILIILSIVGVLVGTVFIVSAGGDDDRVAHGKHALVFSGVSIVLAIIGIILMGIFLA